MDRDGDSVFLCCCKRTFTGVNWAVPGGQEVETDAPWHAPLRWARHNASINGDRPSLSGRLTFAFAWIRPFTTPMLALRIILISTCSAVSPWMLRTSTLGPSLHIRTTTFSMVDALNANRARCNRALPLLSTALMFAPPLLTIIWMTSRARSAFPWKWKPEMARCNGNMSSREADMVAVFSEPHFSTNHGNKWCGELVVGVLVMSFWFACAWSCLFKRNDNSATSPSYPAPNIRVNNSLRATRDVSSVLLVGLATTTRAAVASSVVVTLRELRELRELRVPGLEWDTISLRSVLLSRRCTGRGDAGAPGAPVVPVAPVTLPFVSLPCTRMNRGRRHACGERCGLSYAYELELDEAAALSAAATTVVGTAAAGRVREVTASAVCWRVVVGLVII